MKCVEMFLSSGSLSSPSPFPLPSPFPNLPWGVLHVRTKLRCLEFDTDKLSRTLLKLALNRFWVAKSCDRRTYDLHTYSRYPQWKTMDDSSQSTISKAHLERFGCWLYVIAMPSLTNALLTLQSLLCVPLWTLDRMPLIQKRPNNREMHTMRTYTKL